jgi:hypothetical protein
LQNVISYHRQENRGSLWHKYDIKSNIWVNDLNSWHSVAIILKTKSIILWYIKYYIYIYIEREREWTSSGSGLASDVEQGLDKDRNGNCVNSLFSPKLRLECPWDRHA